MHWVGTASMLALPCVMSSAVRTGARASHAPGQGGHYVPKLRRFLSLLEHGSLQGLPRTVTLHMAEAVGGGERAVRAALGDAMSLKNGSGERSVQRMLSR